MQILFSLTDAGKGKGNPLGEFAAILCSQLHRLAMTRKLSRCAFSCGKEQEHVVKVEICLRFNSYHLNVVFVSTIFRKECNIFPLDASFQ